MGEEYKRGREMDQINKVYICHWIFNRLYGPTALILNWYSGLSQEVKRPGSVTDNSRPSSAEFTKCVELYLHRLFRVVFNYVRG